MKTFTSYVPHGIDPAKFYPIHNPLQKNVEDEDYIKFKNDLFQGNDYEFVIFYNSRNIRRKQPSDVMLGVWYFTEYLKSSGLDHTKTVLVMKTHVQDPNGTDLLAVKDNLFPRLNVIFIEDNLPDKVMNYLYNLADVTVSMSSAEGFGLSIAESIMAGTMVIAPVHGGLQDQMQFSSSDDYGVGSWVPTYKLPSNSRGDLDQTGSWVLPLFPVARQLQGSIQTPYIFDYVVDAKQLAYALNSLYKIPKLKRIQNGLEGREFMMSPASMMNVTDMSRNFKRSVNTLFENWKPKPAWRFEKISYTQPNLEFNGLIK